MQDVNRIYVGCKYTFEELLEAEDISFKFRMIMQRYMLPEANPEDTLETHLYYLLPESFLVKIYKQMKAKVRVNLLEEKRRLFAAGPGGQACPGETVCDKNAFDRTACGDYAFGERKEGDCGAGTVCQ